MSPLILSGSPNAICNTAVSGIASDLHEVNFLHNNALSMVAASSLLIPSADIPEKLLTKSKIC